MSGVVGSVAVRVVPSMSGFGSTLAKEGGAAASKQGRFLGGVMGKALVGGLAVAGVAVAGFGVYALKEFAKFEKGMNEVFTLLPGISEEAMGKMNDDTRKFVREMGIAHDEAVPALYQAISAGVPQENVFDFMEIAAQASIGGVTDLETAVDGITSVVNAYGEETVDAQTASDMMFTAVKNGKTDFEQLSSSLFNVIPTAAALGVGFEDITGGLAQMTAMGTPTSVATTQLRQLFVELSKEGTKTSNVFKDIAGKSFKEFIAEGGNTQEALALLSEHADETGVGINDLFGSVEAGSAALSLSGKNAEGYAQNIADMSDSAGATQAAYETMDEGIARSMERIGIVMSDAAIQIGENLAPVAQSLADFLQENLPAAIDASTAAFETIWGAVEDALQGLRDMGDWMVRNRQTITGFASVIGGAALAVVAFRTALAINQLLTTFSGGLTLARLAMIPFDATARIAAKGQWLLNAAMRANPIGIFITAIGALVGGLAWFFTQTEMGGKIWGRVWDGIKSVTAGVVDWFMTYVVGNFKEFYTMLFKGDFTGSGSMAEDSPVVSFIFKIRDAASTVIGWFKTTFVPVFQSVWAAIVDGANWVWQKLQAAWAGIAAGATWLWGAVKAVFGYLQAGFKAVVAGISWAWNTIGKPIFDALAAVVNWVWTRTIKPVFNFIAAAWQGLVGVFDWWWNGVLKQVFIFMGDLIVFLWKNFVQPYFQRIMDRWRNLAQSLTGAWSNWIKPMILAFGAFIVLLWTTQIQPRFNAIMALWRTVSSTLVSFWRNSILPMIQAFGAWITNLWATHIQPRLNKIMNLWRLVSRQLRMYYYTVIKPMLDAFGAWVRRLYDTYIRPALNSISEKWSWLSGKISDTWQTIKGYLSAFGDFVKDTIVGRVKSGVEQIKEAWESVKSAFAAPINWVINKVWNDGIAKAFNNVSKAIGSDARMAKIPEIGGGGSNSNARRGGAGAMQAYAKGGAVRGPGNGTSDDIVARLSNGEHVLTAAEVKAMGGQDGVYKFRSGLAKGDVALGEHMHPMGGILSWIRGGLASAADKLLKPIVTAASGAMSGFGTMGDLGGGLVDWGVDKVVDWIRGKDTVESSGGGAEFSGPMQNGKAYRPGAGPITSWYGPRGGRLHGGIDFAGPRGTPTFAAWDGVVHSIRNYSGSGLSVNLSHGGGKYSHYGHNDYGGIPVKQGQSVKAGQRIGNMGMTGRTTGPHVHFETWQGGLWNRRNPNHLFRDKGGLLPPGVSSVLNNTGGNEFIFNQKQFENLNRLAERSTNSAGDTFIQNVHNMGSPYQDGADFKRHVSRARRAVSV